MYTLCGSFLWLEWTAERSKWSQLHLLWLLFTLNDLTYSKKVLCLRQSETRNNLFINVSYHMRSSHQPFHKSFSPLVKLASTFPQMFFTISEARINLSTNVFYHKWSSHQPFHKCFLPYVQLATRFPQKFFTICETRNKFSINDFYNMWSVICLFLPPKSKKPIQFLQLFAPKCESNCYL